MVKRLAARQNVGNWVLHSGSIEEKLKRSAPVKMTAQEATWALLLCPLGPAGRTLREYKEGECCLLHPTTTKCRTPPLYHMRIFAPNHVVAKSRLWCFVSQMKKMKKSSGEIVYCGQVLEKSPLLVKNCGIWLHYDSRSGTHNMYRGYQDLTTAGAVTQYYRDMGAQHRARAHSIQIMKVEEITANKCPAQAPAEAPAAQAPAQAPEAQAPAQALAAQALAQASAEAPAARALAEAPEAQTPAQASPEAPAAQAPAEAPEAQALAEALAAQALAEAPEAQAPAQAPEAQAPPQASEAQTSAEAPAAGVVEDKEEGR
ncbi:PREDICTED: paternally-expressed gene 3 protein-like [Elephantulus edwardii]|uniref:paternally-expressed gene 3 protein-like n=1 Tax=Elephantulus edwardii TaxID=28737 RepID=UPI0003F08793|nr:PREDICTED: paternally-expressed gene 3 protein-like [Elephantulus edwardii]